jgi:hypothetical protein
MATTRVGNRRGPTKTCTRQLLARAPSRAARREQAEGYATPEPADIGEAGADDDDISDEFFPDAAAASEANPSQRRRAPEDPETDFDEDGPEAQANKRMRLRLRERGRDHECFADGSAQYTRVRLWTTCARTASGAGPKKRGGELRLRDLGAEERRAFMDCDVAELKSWLDHQAVDVLTAAEEKEAVRHIDRGVSYEPE